MQTKQLHLTKWLVLATFFGLAAFASVQSSPTQKPTQDSDSTRSMQDRDINRDELGRFDRFLDSHREIAEQLRKDPSLVNDRHFVKNHPALQTYLRDHPETREANPATVRQNELRHLEAWLQDSSRPTAENENSTRQDGKNYVTNVAFSQSVGVLDSSQSLSDVMVSTMVTIFTGNSVTGFEMDDYCFDLRDIDPNSISFEKTPEGYFAFTARTINDELKIEERVSESVDGQHWQIQRRQNLSSLAIEFKPDYGSRFTKAFKQAVILAGG